MVLGDITKQDDVDAIVSSININMEVKGSLNKAVIAAAGTQLDEFILEHIYKPRTGDAFAVPAFALPVKHIIYVITPVWRTGFSREDRDLLRCYRHAMQLAQRMNLSKVAFPALGTGQGRFPVRRATRLAVQGITERMTREFEEVRIVCNREETYQIFKERLGQGR